MRAEYFVGLDLGQTTDFTALAVVERANSDSWEHRRYGIRHLQRWPLGTPYPLLVKEVGALLQRPPLKGATLLIDHTGVGRAVVDLFRVAPLEVDMVAITITSGAEATSDPSGKEYRTPKRDLVGVVSVLLQQRRLKIAPILSEVATLVTELQAFKVKFSATGHDTYGAWREGAHDDLVLAVALALWYAEHAGRPGGRFFYIGGQIVDLLAPGRADWP